LVIEDVDVLLGTEEEFAALLGRDAEGGRADIVDEVRTYFSQRPGVVVMLKQGEGGVTAFAEGGKAHTPAFPVEEVSTVGAGDAFAGGLIAARLGGADWEEAARFASACAAITVSRPGCSDGFPSREEAEEYMERPAVAGRVR
jgi:sugar/nucleoside kinase (ribokinase family)